MTENTKITLIVLAILSLYGLVSEMDYQYEVAQEAATPQYNMAKTRL